MSRDAPRDPATKIVADYYEQAAETWDETHGAARHNAHFARQICAQLGGLLAGLAGKSLALELGAGTGPYLETTGPLFGQIIATDVSAGMLGVLQQRIARLGLGNVTVRQQDACDLGTVPTASVDVVYSIGMLETIADFGRLFAESRRVLKPGGSVAGITSNGDCPWYALRRRIEGGERHGRTGRLATAAGLTEALQQSGFAAPEITYWGAVPPHMQNRLLVAALARAERFVAPTPLARYLGVLSFRAHTSHASR